MKVYTLEHHFDGGGYLSGVVGSLREALGMVPRNLVGRMWQRFMYETGGRSGTVYYEDYGETCWFKIREWEVES